MKPETLAAAFSRVLLLSSLLCATSAQAGQWIYIQRQNDGVPNYSDARPLRGPYSRIRAQGRPTAGAACLGLNEHSMQERASFYAQSIRKHASANGLAPELVSAVMRVESCYDRHAVSRAGARGLMQLMPATAAQLGVKDSFDPDQNIAGGVRYLAQMLTRFNHDLKLGLAAYNAGPEAVAAYKDVPPFPDTKSYVSRILKLYKPAT